MELNTPPPPSQDPSSDLSHQPAGAQPLAAEPISPPPPEALYRRIQSYPFHTDQDYQLGLAAILGHPETPPTASELVSNQDLVLQAQCFYLARRFGLGQIDVEAYKEWLAISQRAKEALLQRGTSNDGTSFAAPRPVSVPTPMREQERPKAPTPSTAAAALDLPVQPPSPASPPQDQDRPSAPSPSTAAAATTPSINPHAQTPSTPPPQASDPAPPYPPSFAQIVDLITQNKPIPGIEEIPTTVLEPGSSKQDRASRRKKPWEQADENDNKNDGGAAADTEGERTAAADNDTTSPNEEQIDVEQRKQTGEGVLKILQPGAIPDSGLVAKE